MKTLNEYEQRELAAFRAQKYAYFDNVKSFSESLADMNIAEQIRWIENGTYGCGACLALQKAFQTACERPRMNGKAIVGGVILHAFYGKPFKGWQKLPPGIQAKFDAAVADWMAGEKDFAAQWID